MSAELAWLVVGAVLAGFVQGLSGFGFSMVAMSFWVWGVEPRVAAIMAVFGAMTGQIVAALSSRGRRGLHLRALAPFLAGGVVGIPVGIAALPHLNADLFKLVLGSVLIVVCPLMLFASNLPRISRGGRLADGVAGAIGGAMGGIGGFTGVVPTLWCTLRGMEKDAQRAVIQNFNLAALAFTMLGYVIAGAVTPDLWPLMPVVAVALLVPSLLGTRVYIGLSEVAFRRVVLVLLGVSGMVMLVSVLPRLL